MYRRESSGWGKHYDFIILDLICLQLALLLSYVIRGLGYNPYVNILYRRLGIFLIFADMAVIFKKGILPRFCDNDQAGWVSSVFDAVVSFSTEREQRLFQADFIAVDRDLCDSGLCG